MTMPGQKKQSNTKKLTPELVKAISERVYAMLLADLRRERERSGRIRPIQRPNARP
jgi:hypothetical protein